MPDKQFLDYDGLRRYHGKLKDDLKSENGSGSSSVSSEVKKILNLPDSATLDDVLLQLSIGSGNKFYFVHVQLDDGTPIEGATIGGLEQYNGISLTTDANGDALGMSNGTEATISASSPYIDYDSGSIKVTPENITTRVTLTLNKSSSTYKSFSSSGDVYLSPSVKTIDVTTVGGGGGGGYATDWDENGYGNLGGAGGGGGYVSTSNNVTLASPILTLNIGSGGSGGGGGGGTTSVYYKNGSLIRSASGGSGGSGMNGGSGNGSGANGSANVGGNPGGSGSGYIFGESSLGAAGGGGGGNGGSTDKYGSYTYPNGSGGSPYGGSGGSSGRGPGGGGGGGVYYKTEKRAGGSGGSGRVCMRWHY